MRYLPEDDTETWRKDNAAGSLYWQLQVPCPDCGQIGVEQPGPWAEAWSDAARRHDPLPARPDDTGDHTAVTVHRDRDDYDSPVGTRGGFTQIDLTCPGGVSSP